MTAHESINPAESGAEGLPGPADADVALQQGASDELSPEGRLARIRSAVTEVFGGEVPDVVFAHSGGMYFNERRGTHQTTSYSQLTEHGLATGGRLRVIATAAIADAIPEVGIVTNSFNRFDPEEPTMASIVEGELTHRGVNPERIQREESSFSTITQLVEMVRLAVENKWERIAAMTNEFHFPRMIEMFERLDSIIDDDAFQQTLREFKQQGTQVGFITAESILRLVDSKYGNYIDQVARSPQYAHTVAAEAKGLEDLRAGRYRVVLTPEKPRG